MFRALTALTFASALAGLAHADGHLAGGPMPSVTAHGAAACHSKTTTETVHGVRVHRSEPVGCAMPAREPTSQRSPTSRVAVTVNNRINLAPRRRGTRNVLVGAPGYWRGTGTRKGYVLGAPTP
ncbi:MAG: hypothetical protein AAFQ22_01650 [Pseudomonadota bacterium]